jgi:hypothetical protein
VPDSKDLRHVAGQRAAHVALGVFFHEGLQRGIQVGASHPADDATLDDMHDAPVAQDRHGELGELLQGGLVFERLRQRLPGVGQEAHRRLGPLAFLDLLAELVEEQAVLQRGRNLWREGHEQANPLGREHPGGQVVLEAEHAHELRLTQDGECHSERTACPAT